MRIGAILAALVMLSACSENDRDNYRYLVWVNYSGFYTNEYQIEGGVLSFTMRDGRKMVTNTFEIVENKRYNGNE